MASRRLSPFALFAVLLFGACDGETTPIEPAAGARLAPLYREGKGARIFVGWFDRELQTECALVGDNDGQTRCYPTGLTLSAHTDPQCVSPLVEVACPGTRFRTEIPFGAPPQPFSLAPVGPVPPLFHAQQDTCMAVSVLPWPRLPANASLVAATPIPVTALVPMHDEVVQLNDELEVVVRVGSDGSRSPHAWRDRKRASRCLPAWTEQGLRCLPGWPSPALPVVHIDSACTLPLAPFGGVAEEIVGLPDAGPPNAPPPRSPFGDRLIALYRLAPVARDVPTFVKTPEGCVPFAMTREGEFAATERIDAQAYPKLEPPSSDWLADTMFQIGNQRVVLDEQPSRLRKRGGASCRLSILPDGRMACLQGDQSISASSEEGCSELAYFDPFVTPRRLLTQGAGDSICNSWATRIFALTPLATPPPNPRTGQPCGIAQDPRGFQHPAFAVGPELPPGPDDVVFSEPAPLP